MIWDHAANLSPQIHFFLSHHPPFITWESHQPLLDLIPHRESGAHTRVSLCLACRAARAAVDRQINTDSRESLMLTPVTSWDTPTTPRAALDMDLETDLVCFGGPDDDGGALWKPASWGEGLWNTANWGEGRHLLFCTAQRVAVRYRPGWDNPVFGRLPHDVRCPGRWVDAGWQDKAARGFCSRCLARWLEKFLCLEEFYLILDEADLGRTFHKGERKRHWGRSVPEPRAGSGVFYSFGRTYFTPGVSETDAATMEACGVLERMRANLVGGKRVDDSACERALLTS
jgi:hypothetical protein